MRLASQWGRDTTFQPRRGNAGAIIVVAILSLALGFAGGYGAFRFLQPDFLAGQDIAAPPVEPDPEIARLTEALALATKDLEAARAAEALRLAEVEELKAQTVRQTNELDAMAERLAQMSSEAPPVENSAARDLEALVRERDALIVENQGLASDLAALEADREALRQESLAAQARLEAELAALSDQVVPELSAERDSLQRQMTELLSDQNARSAELEAAERTRAEDARRVAELETRLQEITRALAAAETALAAMQAVQAAAPAASEPDAPAEAQPSGVETQAAPARAPRDPQAVAAALRSAPGIGALSAADREILGDRLISGECVTTALEDVFDRVPILTLRNLIRDLNSDC